MVDAVVVYRRFEEVRVGFQPERFKSEEGTPNISSWGSVGYHFGMFSAGGSIFTGDSVSLCS